ncbi:hypothetical protein PR048_007783 [Dryococelus australis]|uniref:Uncharacterized protein n=1 Tax=Dryococelus australis TaxID=614101 RepID=A0ABQ9HVA2_9NEOP|nr:hypothetical protein PR048_007783 [Dryococelus australis]
MLTSLRSYATRSSRAISQTVWVIEGGELAAGMSVVQIIEAVSHAMSRTSSITTELVKSVGKTSILVFEPQDYYSVAVSLETGLWNRHWENAPPTPPPHPATPLTTYRSLSSLALSDQLTLAVTAAPSGVEKWSTTVLAFWRARIRSRPGHHECWDVTLPQARADSSPVPVSVSNFVPLLGRRDAVWAVSLTRLPPRRTGFNPRPVHSGFSQNRNSCLDFGEPTSDNFLSSWQPNQKESFLTTQQPIKGRRHTRSQNLAESISEGHIHIKGPTPPFHFCTLGYSVLGPQSRKVQRRNFVAVHSIGCREALEPALWGRDVVPRRCHSASSARNPFPGRVQTDVQVVPRPCGELAHLGSHDLRKDAPLLILLLTRATVTPAEAFCMLRDRKRNTEQSFFYDDVKKKNCPRAMAPDHNRTTGAVDTSTIIRVALTPPPPPLLYPDAFLSLVRREESSKRKTGVMECKAQPPGPGNFADSSEDKLNYIYVYICVRASIGPKFVRQATSDFQPITNLQGKYEPNPVLPGLGLTGATANELLTDARMHEGLWSLACCGMNLRNFRVSSHSISRLVRPDFIPGLVVELVIFFVAGAIPAFVPGQAQSHRSFRSGSYSSTKTFRPRICVLNSPCVCLGKPSQVFLSAFTAIHALGNLLQRCSIVLADNSQQSCWGVPLISSAGLQKREILKKTRRQAASSGTISTCENSGATPPGICRTRVVLLGGEQSNHYTIASPFANGTSFNGHGRQVAPPITSPFPSFSTCRPLRGKTRDVISAAAATNWTLGNVFCVSDRWQTR